MTKPIPKVYATRFFQLVTSRRFAEAERILERVKQKMHISERNHGYLQALYGILLTQKNNDDRYAFMCNIDVTNKKHLKEYRQEFLNHVGNRLHAEYDRGFFQAWADYMKLLPKLNLSVSSTVNKSVANGEKEADVKIENEAKEKTTDQIRSAEKEKSERDAINRTKNEKSAKRKAETEEFEPRQSTLVDFPG